MDVARRSLVYVLTYLLGFLGTLVIVASATRPDTTVWLPIGLAFVFYAGLASLRPLRSAVLRLLLAGALAAGSIALWLMSEAPAASEPNQRLGLYVPFLGLIGPALCLIVVIFLPEERRGVSAKTWLWIFVYTGLAWFTSFFSTQHSRLPSRRLLLPEPDTTVIGQVSSVSHRGVIQVLFFALVTFAAWQLARASGARAAHRVLLALALSGALIFFDEARPRFEVTGRFAVRSVELDATITIAIIICLELFALLGARSGKATD